MVSLSFSNMRDKLISGEKRHTIRKLNFKRLHQMRKTNILQIYWKLRTKETDKLFDAKLIDVTLFVLDKTGYPWAYVGDATYPFSCVDIDVDLIRFPHRDAEKLAKKDGFVSIEEMQTWFVKQYGDNTHGDYVGIEFVKIGERVD